MNTAANDTNVDTSTNQVYNTDQQASPSSDDLEARKSELIERYSATLEQGTAEEIEKVEREIKIFLGEEAPPAEEAVAPETPPAQDPAQPPNTEATPSATDGAPPASNENGEEWLASLDPKVREIVLQKLDTERKAREYHEQRYKSDIGRISAYQRKAEEAEKAKQELERKLREGVPSQPANQQPATQQVAQTATARKIQELNERIAKLKGTDPELADVLETTRDALLETQQLMANSVPKVDLSSVEELKQKIAYQEQEMLIQNERARLEQMVPGALSVIDYVDPKTKWSPWQEFVSSLPPALSTAANDANADTYAYLMPMYVQWAERYNAAHGFVQPTQQEAHQPVSQAGVDPRAAQVQQARQQKLTTSAAAPAKSSPPPAYKPSLEERMKNPPAPGTPEYAKFLEEVDKALQSGKLEL